MNDNAVLLLMSYLSEAWSHVSCRRHNNWKNAKIAKLGEFWENRDRQFSEDQPKDRDRLFSADRYKEQRIDRHLFSETISINHCPRGVFLGLFSPYLYISNHKSLELINHMRKPSDCGLYLECYLYHTYSSTRYPGSFYVS